MVCVDTDTERRPRAGWPSTTLAEDGDGPARKRILFPYNGSQTAERALDVVADWCNALGAEAWVLYVRPWDSVRGGHIFVETPGEARAVAQAAVRRLRARGVSASGEIRNASRAGIAKTIVAEADALGASSIVIGTPAHRVLREVLTGSTSLSVARRSSRPVILVKAPRRDNRCL
jgi:nucleotide-binding universal stress UspA family protein